MDQDTQITMDVLLKNDIVDRHSFFQLKYFVVGKEPTTQAKMWRCLRELKTRKEAITSLKMEIEECKDKQELEKIALENLNNIQESRELEIKKRQIGRHISHSKITLEQLQSKLKYTEEEADFFVKAFLSLHKVEKLLPQDDVEAQTAYWNEKLSQELQMKLLLQQPLDVELVKTILALDSKVPVKEATTKMLESIKLQLEAIQRKQLE